MNNTQIRSGKIIFAGRLIEEKGILNIIQAVAVLKRRKFDCKLTIVGDGNAKEHAVNLAHELQIDVKFINTVPQEELIDLYMESEVFISLCPNEPFGLVFVEALIAGCKIVAPFTGGQREALAGYEKYVTYVNPQDIESVTDGIIRCMSQKEAPVLSEIEMVAFTYNDAAKTIIDHIRK